MTILVIAPTFDIPTSLSAMAAADLTAFLKARNIPFTPMFGLLPGRWYFETFLKTHPDVDTIFYLGHGGEDKLYGSEVFWAMLDTQNDGGNLLQGKIIWVMACLSGQLLGPDVVTKGVRAYFGHLVLYNAAYNEEEHEYLKDWIDYVTHTPKLLVQGYTCGAAFDGYKAKLGGYVTQYKLFAENPAKYPNSDWLVTTAESNLTQARLFGDVNARLNLPPPASQGTAPPT